jgi:hypothetical protein
LLYKPKLTVLRLLCSSAGLSGFLDYLMMEWRSFGVVVVIWAVVYFLTCCHNFQEPGHRIQLCCPFFWYEKCFEIKQMKKQCGTQQISVWHESLVWVRTLK